MSVMRNIGKMTLFFVGSTSAVLAGACVQSYKTTGSKKSLAVGFGLGALAGLCIGGSAAMDRTDTINKTVDQVNDHLLRNGIGTIRKEDLI